MGKPKWCLNLCAKPIVKKLTCWNRGGTLPCINHSQSSYSNCSYFRNFKSWKKCITKSLVKFHLSLRSFKMMNLNRQICRFSFAFVLVICCLKTLSELQEKLFTSYGGVQASCRPLIIHCTDSSIDVLQFLRYHMPSCLHILLFSASSLVLAGCRFTISVKQGHGSKKPIPREFHQSIESKKRP